MEEEVHSHEHHDNQNSENNPSDEVLEMDELMDENQDHAHGDCKEHDHDHDHKEEAMKVIVPSNCVDLADDMEYLQVIGTMGIKVTHIKGINHLTNLRELVLRSCLISKMENLDNFVLLERLELYDNQITNLENLSSMTNLRVLDMSFNLIKDMSEVAYCPLLEEVYLAQNKIKSINSVSNLSYLRILDLGANRIRTIGFWIGGMEGCESLCELWLGKNKIENFNLDEISHLPLTRLDLQSNRLVSMEGLGELEGLKELLVSFNNISELEIPSSLTSLDASHNSISSLANLSSPFPLLDDLVLSTNPISLPDIESAGDLFPNLCSLSLQHTPASEEFEYRMKVTNTFQALEDLDFLPINRQTK